LPGAGAGARQDRPGRHRLDDLRHRPGADDDDTGLALFYCGMVRKKNVLATMAQSLACVGLCSLLWFAVGYSLSFFGDGPWLGTFDACSCVTSQWNRPARSRRTIPELLFMFYQMTFAIITVALVAGAVADRMRFSAFLWFAAGWLLLSIVPIAQLGLGRPAGSPRPACSTSPAHVVHLNAGVAGLVAALVLGKRYGYGSDNFRPFDLSLAVIGTGLLWSAGSASTAARRSAPIHGRRLPITHPPRRLDRRNDLDVLEWWTRGKPSVLGMNLGRHRRPRHRSRRRPVSCCLGTAWSIGLIAGSICFWACTWPEAQMRLRRFVDVFRRARRAAATGTCSPACSPWPPCRRAPIIPAGRRDLIEGNARQLLVQFYAVVATIVWSGALTYVLLKVIAFLVPLPGERAA